MALSPVNPLPPSNALASQLNQLVTEVNASKVSVGNGLQSTKRPDGGIHIEAIQQPSQNGMWYDFSQPSYDPNAEAFPGTVVFIDSSQTYTDAYTFPNNPTLTFGSGSLNGTGSVSAGAFVCVRYVPPAWATASVFVNQVVPAFPQGANLNDIAQQYRWNGLNWYYPVNPPVPGNAWSNVTVGSYTIQAGNCYWKPLGTAQTGSSQNWFQGYWTGSGNYQVGQGVVFNSGIAGGTYISIANNNNTIPDVGPNWIQVSYFGTLI